MSSVKIESEKLRELIRNRIIEKYNTAQTRREDFVLRKMAGVKVGPFIFNKKSREKAEEEILSAEDYTHAQDMYLGHINRMQNLWEMSEMSEFVDVSYKDYKMLKMG